VLSAQRAQAEERMQMVRRASGTAREALAPGALHKQRDGMRRDVLRENIRWQPRERPSRRRPTSDQQRRYVLSLLRVQYACGIHWDKRTGTINESDASAEYSEWAKLSSVSKGMPQSETWRTSIAARAQRITGREVARAPQHQANTVS
jgi:hypothetical protein